MHARSSTLGGDVARLSRPRSRPTSSTRDNFGRVREAAIARFRACWRCGFAKDEENEAGIYLVYRNQRNALVTDGSKATDAFIVDAAFRQELVKKRNLLITAGLEAAYVTGTTTQGRTDQHPVMKVGQFGAAGKLSFKVRTFTLLFDAGFASGDQNPGDDRIENFRFDRDFKVGLVLFDHVLAYQSAARERTCG